MEYEYDVFLSYCRSNDQAIQWTQDVLFPTLRNQLHLEARLDRVFMDVHQIETGGRWPERLREAALRSRQLVAVLSPQYFESGWCQYELGTFMTREERSGVTLIWPLRVFDGDCYPKDFTDRVQIESFDDWSILRKGGHRVKLDRKIKDLARRIGRRDAGVPPLDPAWEEASTRFPLERPRSVRW